MKVPRLLLESTAAGGLRVCGRSVRPLTRVLFDLVLLTLFVISFFKRVNVCVRVFFFKEFGYKCVFPSDSAGQSQRVALFFLQG